jgi:branched-chain amino acid transport system substrate-binding protein
VIGLNKLSTGDEKPTTEPGCTTNLECTEQATAAAAAIGADAAIDDKGTVPAVCLQSEHRCVNLLSEDCKTITGDYANDRAIVIGSLFAVQGTTATQNIPRQQSATLAVEEINSIGGIPSSEAGNAHPLVMVSCDTSVDLVRAATHLATDLKVPAIVGPNTSQDTLDVSNKVTIQAGVVVVSPTAVAASIADLLDNDLTWLMIPTDDQRTPLMIKDINNMETSLKASRGVSTIKFSIVYRSDALGVGTRNSLNTLKINGAALTDLANAGSATGNARIVSYDAKGANFSQIVQDQVDFSPDIVVLAGTAETVTKILTPLEQGWKSANRPYYYFIDPSKGPELLNAVVSNGTINDDLRLRIRGTGTTPMPESQQVTESFNLAYLGKYASAPTASGAGACYDAVYSVAYALAAIKDAPLTGANVALGLRKLAGDSPKIETGTPNLLQAFQTLASGNEIQGVGTNCPLEWDSRGIVADGMIEMWCIGKSGQTPKFASSTLTYNIKTGAYGGQYAQCDP